MFRKNGFVLGLLGAMIGLGACQPKSTIPVQVAPTHVSVSLEMAATALPPTPMPIATVTALVPTRQSTPDPTVTPTPIPASPVALIPTATVTPTFPEWIAEADANILLLYKNNSDGTDTISILDVESDKRHEIHVAATDFGPQWLWQDDLLLLSPNMPQPNADVLDIVTGEFRKLERVDPQALSPNGRYLAHSKKDSLGSVSIIDYETTIETELVNPFRNVQSRDEDFNEYAFSTWSPDGTFLSVVYEKHYYSDNYDLNLVVYMPSGEIYRQYSNLNIPMMGYWAPALPHRILYRQRNQLCLLEIVENERICVKAIEDFVDNRDAVITSHGWSPDGTQIIFVYNSDNFDTFDSGACYYEIVAEKITCLMSIADLYPDERKYIRHQIWSPSGKYAAVLVDGFGFSEHVFGSVTVIVADIENQTFRFIEGEYSWPFNNPWRPSLSKPSDE